MHNIASQVDLQSAARQVMEEHGFQPDFPPQVNQQLSQILNNSNVHPDPGFRDLRSLLWSSIDNDTSRDLDQVEVAERLPGGGIKVLVGIADVDWLVPKATPIDLHAAVEGTTVYTGVENFSMLPEQLSTGLTSLLENEDRRAIVIEFVVDADGCLSGFELYPALLRNRAQLTYNAVGAWLGNGSSAPPKVAASPDLQAQVRLQDECAQLLKKARERRGALNIDTIEVRPLLVDQKIVNLVQDAKNRATDLIEDFMIAANETVAKKLESVSSIRRIVKTPERWDRIVALAAAHGGNLPAQPDAKALNDFLQKRKAVDPDHFPDVSLTVIKLMGPGEYVLERPGDPDQGHFGLAVQDYTHSTAPNRRYADLVTQRIIKATLAANSPAYSDAELADVARVCTLKEDAARKVEREMRKRIAAVAMSDKIGQTFDAIVTGVNEHGSFVRVLQPHVEGMLVQGKQGLDVGDRLRVKLVRTDAHRGYIDFARAT
jgi:VacB/RNase II family 3'-5' exoribonuclease